MNIEKFQSLTFRIENASAEKLNHRTSILDLLEKIAKIANLTVVGKLVKEFDPQGLTAILALSESHIAIHTWPENNHAYVTLTTCSSIDPEKIRLIEKEIAENLCAEKIITKETRC